MKIRFSKSDQIDTTNIEGGGSAPENYSEVENAALDSQAVINDSVVDTDDNTRFNYVLRALRAIMYWAETQDSGDPSLKGMVEELFADILDFSGKQAHESWGRIKDEFFDYGTPLEEEEPVE